MKYDFNPHFKSNPLIEETIMPEQVLELEIVNKDRAILQRF